MYHLSRILFWLNLTLGASLIALVLVCPLADNGAESPDGLARVVALFARDGTLRRTALASAAGLAVAAILFYRAGRKPKFTRPRPPAIAGA